MKNLRLAAVLAVFVLQKTLGIGQILADEQVMSIGMRPALTAHFATAKPKYVENLWEDFLKEEFGAKPKWLRKQKEWQALDVKNAGLGSDVPVDFYARADEKGDGTAWTVWVDLDADEFVSKNSAPEAFRAAESLVERFQKRVAAQQKKDRIDAEDKKLRELEADLKKLQRENDRLTKSIEDYKKKITKAESNLVENGKEQEKAKTDIENQQKALEKAQTEN